MALRRSSFCGFQPSQPVPSAVTDAVSHRISRNHRDAVKGFALSLRVRMIAVILRSTCPGQISAWEAAVWTVIRPNCFSLFIRNGDESRIVSGSPLSADAVILRRCCRFRSRMDDIVIGACIGNLRCH